MAHKKRYLLKILESGQYLTYPSQENDYMVYSSDITKAHQFTGEEAERRMYNSGETYERITIFVPIR